MPKKAPESSPIEDMLSALKSSAEKKPSGKVKAKSTKAVKPAKVKVPKDETPKISPLKLVMDAIEDGASWSVGHDVASGGASGGSTASTVFVLGNTAAATALPTAGTTVVTATTLSPFVAAAAGVGVGGVGWSTVEGWSTVGMSTTGIGNTAGGGIGGGTAWVTGTKTVLPKPTGKAEMVVKITGTKVASVKKVEGDPLVVTEAEVCAYCHGTKRVVWNPFDYGPPPPPKDWDEARSWVWDFVDIHVIDCPQCTPRGWGYAPNGPWGEASRIANKQYPYAEKGGGFTAATEYVLDWYHRGVTNNFKAIEAQFVAAKRSYYLDHLMRTHVRGKSVPNWPLFTDNSSCSQCNSMNFAPTYHPRTFEKAIGCCECGYGWITGPAYTPTPKEVESLRYSLYGLGFSSKVVDDLISQYHYYELNQFGLPYGGSSAAECLPDLR